MVKASTEWSRHQLNGQGINSMVKASTEWSRHQFNGQGINSMVKASMNGQGPSITCHSTVFCFLCFTRVSG